MHRALLVWVVAACTERSESRGGPARAPPAVAPASASDAAFDATAPPGDGATMQPTAEVVVIAKIANAGPIGDGPKCNQRSYEIEVVKIVAGNPGEQRFWVHFEACRDAPPPEPGLGALAVGTTYKLVLRRGTSGNFNGYMITSAHPP
jgi:hypothetical protein